MNKADIRREVRFRRRALSAEYRRKASRKLASSLNSNARFRFARNVSLYLSNDGEIDTTRVIQNLLTCKRAVYLPVLHPLKKGFLSFVRYQPGKTRMRLNRFGIAEPDFRSGQRLSPRFLSVICLPLVAFDQQGNRLGMGGGFYDRTLERIHQNPDGPWLVGCAFECQRMDLLPAEAWDIPLSAIATETRLRLFH